MITGLAQRQSQTMTLAPQLRQGLKLLAMSLPELRNELISEMAHNPVIDDIEQTLEKTTISQKESESIASEVVSDYPEDDNAIDAARMEGFNRPDDYMIGGGYDGRITPDADAIERHQKLLDSQTEEETLSEHLLKQLPYSEIDEKDYALAEILIGELDERGRFVGSIPDIMTVSGESEAKIRQLLRMILTFDPPGCGAITPQECLEAQLDAITDYELRLRVKRLIGRLEDVAAGKIKDEEALKALRALNPKPGLQYRKSGRSVEYINPEVHLVKCEDGWSARVDARSLPEIRISPRYVAMLENPDIDKETKAYIRERIASARTIVEAVEKRSETIENVAQEIFDRQPGFFKNGLKGLTPMTMQEIADKLGLHVATISRTVNGKYAKTPRGTVEMRRLFSQGITTDSGEVVSKDGVFDRLKSIIEAEDKQHPLSDEKISQMLKAEGFPVARRTVVKYRGILNIPSATARKA